MADTRLYDELGEDYDRMVDWAARLSAEMPMLLRVLRGLGAVHVLDAACGTGRHAIALAEAGFQVIGADPSKEMLRIARSNAERAGVAVRWVEAPLGGLASQRLGDVDAALCLGNSLVHLLSAGELANAFRDLRSVLRPGGVLVTQSRNYDCLDESRLLTQPLERREAEGSQWLFARFSETVGQGDDGVARILFHIVTMRQSREGEWSYTVSVAAHRPVLSRELASALAASGFGRVELLGNLEGARFDRNVSSDIVAVARVIPGL